MKYKRTRKGVIQQLKAMKKLPDREPMKLSKLQEYIEQMLKSEIKMTYFLKRRYE